MIPYKIVLIINKVQLQITKITVILQINYTTSYNVYTSSSNENRWMYFEVSSHPTSQLPSQLHYRLSGKSLLP